MLLNLENIAEPQHALEDRTINSTLPEKTVQRRSSNGQMIWTPSDPQKKLKIRFTIVTAQLVRKSLFAREYLLRIE